MTETPSAALHGSVLSALGTAIVSGTHAPGDVLTLDGVCVRYRVSRSVAREAIRVLESMGMVASRRRVGITIQPTATWNVFDPRLIRWRLDSDDRARQLASLSELRRDDIAEFRRGLVIVRDRARLEEHGDFDPSYLYGEGLLKVEHELDGSD